MLKNHGQPYSGKYADEFDPIETVSFIALKNYGSSDVQDYPNNNTQ